MWEASDGEGAKAGMAGVSFAFRPLLGGREITIYGPKQHGPLQTLLGVMIATVAEAEAEIAPAPLGRHPLQAAVIIEGIEHDIVKMEIEELRNINAEGVLA